MDAPFDVARAHRWFAVEFNNAAWELVEAAERTPEETARMLQLAQGAALHWSAVGKPVNQQRAAQLLAHAYALAGQAVQAVHDAKGCLSLSEGNPEGQTPFDRAAARVALSHALRVAGRQSEADSWAEQARTLILELEADDRPVLERLLALGR